MDTSHLSPIYHWLMGRFPAYRWQAPWDFLPSDPDCRGTARTPRTFAGLRDRFGEDLLLDAGVMQKPPRGPARIHPALVKPGSALIALRDQPGAAPFGVLTHRGLLAGHEPPFVAAQRDVRTATWLQETGTLIGTFDVRDCAACAASVWPLPCSAHGPGLAY